MRTKEKIQLSIDTLVSGGDGLGRHDGQPVFVARTAPGDVAEVEIFDARKDFARGRLINLVQPSKHRVDPLCKLFKVCGGCQWQHLSYEAQLKQKQEIVKEAITRIGKLPSDMVRETIRAKEPFYYRNRVQLPVKNPTDSKRLLAGYYEQDSHELVNIKHCPVQPSSFDELLNQVKELSEKYNISAYNENTQKGTLRHICMRRGANDQLLLCLVINLSPERKIPGNLQALASELKDNNPNLAGICVNFNDRSGNRIYGSVTKTAEGQSFIKEHLASHLPEAPVRLKAGLDFQVSTTSFFQINLSQAEVMLDLVFEAAHDGTSTQPIIIDAYAGVGTMALWLASLASRVIAMEESPSAVNDANENIKLNCATNVDFHQGRVEELLPLMVSQGVRPDILILDPPRKGVAKTVIENAFKLQPAKIIYVSCNPATLARDLNELSQKYQIKSIQPVDMFPQTFHIESVSVLERIDT